MRWLQRLFGRLRAPKPLPAPERRRLEDWVRLRFRLEPADPMTAIIAASGRLKEAGMDADEAVETVLSAGGITATLTANVGLLNTTASGFGVNHPTAGDPTDQIDGVNANESVSVTFDVPVSFDTLVLSLFTPTPTAPELATVTIGSAPPFPLVPQASATDTYNFSLLNTVNVGEAVVLAWVSGNGFSFDSFSVTAAPRAVPEPATLLLLGGGLVGLAAWRRQGSQRGSLPHDSNSKKILDTFYACD